MNTPIIEELKTLQGEWTMSPCSCGIDFSKGTLASRYIPLEKQCRRCRIVTHTVLLTSAMEEVNEDERFWRDVLGPMEDLLIDWQCRPCGCKEPDSYLFNPGAGELPPRPTMCKRCKIVSLATQFKYALKEE